MNKIWNTDKTYAGEDVEQQKPLSSLAGMQNGTATSENSLAFS